MRTTTCAALLILILSTPLHAREWLVKPGGNGDVPTIQAAADSCEEGDTILLANGVFRGVGNRDIRMSAYDVTIRSVSGNPKACVIDGGGKTVIFVPSLDYLAEGKALKLHGVTIRNADKGVLAGNYFADFLERISNCRFENCGTGVWTLNDIVPVVEDTVFERNGLAIVVGYGGMELRNCEFSRNERDFRGVEMCLKMVDCTMRDTRGTSIFVGMDSSAQLEECVIERCGGWAFEVTNNASLYAERCTIVDGKGGVFREDEAILDASFIDCVIADNRSPGPLFLSEFSLWNLEFDRCTIAGNATRNAPLFEALAGADFEEVSIRNTIIAFNDVTELFAGVPPREFEMTCSDIYDNSDNDWNALLAPWRNVAGNIEADPLFCNVHAGDYRIAEDSPCVDGECGVMGADIGLCGRSVPVGRRPWLGGPTPNPANGGVTAVFSLPSSGRVDISVYDVRGRLVETLVAGDRAAGEHVLRWDPRSRASGVYFIRMTSPGLVQTRKITVLK